MRFLSPIFQIVLSGSVLSMFGFALNAAQSQNAPPRTLPTEALTQQATDILRARCQSCHSSTVKSGGIDLSARAEAIHTGALTLDKPAGSKLLRMAESGKMPPTGKLPDTEIAVLKRWITSGAIWPLAGKNAMRPPAPLWSLQSVRRPAVPHSPFDSLAANPIDNFVFARLAAKGLRPSPLADKLTLLRRVSIDMTGLLPTPEERAAFLKDTSANAYEKVVDRLLASPAYGERWGRHWLDIVRYGESHGYEQNHLRPNAWPYRDYVIQAFNEDKPYPQFIAEQLAGDVLGAGDPCVNAATGFLVAGIHDTVGIQTEEGTRQQRANDLDDIAATTGATFLGLTVGCARCHDHKFDPIPQKDYYRLTACFAGVRHGERPLPQPQTGEAKEALITLPPRIQTLSNQINALDGQARETMRRQRGAPPESRPGVTARRNVDDFAPVRARFVRFTVLATRDGAEPCLDELQVFGADETRNLALAQNGAKATASSLLPGYAIHQIKHLNDGQFGNEWSWISAARGTGWAQIELPVVAQIQRVVWSRDAADIPRFDDRLPSAYRIDVSANGDTWQTVATQMGRSGSSDYIHPDVLLQALTAGQRKQRETLVQERTRLEGELNRLHSLGTAYVGQFTTPDPIFLLNRGDVMQRQEPVLAGALSCVSGLKSDFDLSANAPEPERRLALARWIGDVANPLTGRVLVNRVWQYHFGRGLVSTPSDFGRNGVSPTHPELLDWLASVFVAKADRETRRQGDKEKSNLQIAASTPNTLHPTPYECDGRLKRLHKLLVLSYTYRQATEANAKGLATDAGNQLLWHMPLHRMEGEAIRDAILQASGKLDRHMGGPSFALFQYRIVNVAIYEPQENYGPETWRRSVYQQAARGIHDEVLSAFDCPESSQRAPHRESTTTALQALNLLNGPFMIQQAGLLAERLRSEAGPETSAQIARAFQLTLGRAPAPDEQKAALLLVRAQGLPALCRALLNANEFLYY